MANMFCKAGKTDRTPPNLGGVLLVLPSFQLLSRLLSAAWPLFPLPVTGWNRDGRPQNLLLPESAVSRLRPSRFGQSSGVLPQWPPQGTPCPGLPHLPETLLRAQGYGPVPLQARRRKSPLRTPAFARELRRPPDQPLGGGQQGHGSAAGLGRRPAGSTTPRRARGCFPLGPAKCSSMRSGPSSPRRRSTVGPTIPWLAKRAITGIT